MKNYLVFTDRIDIAKLWKVVEGEAERDRIIEHYKKTYGIEVYWLYPVHVGKEQA